MASSAVIKAGYYPNWAVDAYPPPRIDTTLFTHVMYAFLQPNTDTFRFDKLDQAASNFTSALRAKNPQVKTLAAIGGWGFSDTFFARMVQQAGSREVFITSSIQAARKYGFDGLDLDWEFPQSPQEMTDLGLLFKEWRSAIVNEARYTGQAQLLLTAAVRFTNSFWYGAEYPAASMNENLDWVNVMSYDLHGPWEPNTTGSPAALRDPRSNANVEFGIQSWINAGLSKPKIVMGLPLYGRTWMLKSADQNGIGAPAVSVGPGDDGTMTFPEVVNFNAANHATVVYDPATVSTYSYAGLTWIGYDDATSTTKKVQYARDLGLRGYFFWSLNQDQASVLPRQAAVAWYHNI